MELEAWQCYSVSLICLFKGEIDFFLIVPTTIIFYSPNQLNIIHLLPPPHFLQINSHLNFLNFVAFTEPSCSLPSENRGSSDVIESHSWCKSARKGENIIQNLFGGIDNSTNEMPNSVNRAVFGRCKMCLMSCHMPSDVLFLLPLQLALRMSTEQ